MRVCQGKTKNDITACPAACAAFDLERLPTFLGGKSLSQLGRFPNDLREKADPPTPEAVAAAIAAAEAAFAAAQLAVKSAALPAAASA